MGPRMESRRIGNGIEESDIDEFLSSSGHEFDDSEFTTPVPEPDPEYKAKTTRNSNKQTNLYSSWEKRKSADAMPRRSKKQSSASSSKDALKALGDFLGTIEDNNSDTAPKPPLASSRKQKNVITKEESELRKRYFDGIDFSPTKKKRIDSAIRSAARQGQDTSIESKHDEYRIFDRSTYDVNRYEDDLEKAQPSEWRLFMTDHTTRYWFFVNGLFHQFNPELFPKINSIYGKWIQHEIVRQGQSARLRERYCEAWILLMKHSVAKGSMSFIQGYAAAKNMLILAGASKDLLSDGSVLEPNTVAIRSLELQLPNVEIIEAVIRCIGEIGAALACYKSSHPTTAGGLVMLFRLLALCGTDYMLSTSGSRVVPRAIALMVDGIQEESLWGQVRPQLLDLLHGQLVGEVVHLRLLNIITDALVESSHQKRLSDLRMQFATLTFVEKSSNVSALQTADSALVSAIMPALYRDELYQKRENRQEVFQILKRKAPHYKFKMLYLTHALTNLSSVRKDNNSPETSDEIRARQNLFSFCKRLSNCIEVLDRAGDNPHYYGLQTALDSLQTLISYKYSEVVDEFMKEIA